MRNISFALTTQQILDRTKTVTRRTGWKFLTPGTLLQPVLKSQGIPKGGCVEKIGCPIRVVSVWIESIDALVADQYAITTYGRREVDLEGFPHESVEWFVNMFCATHKCDRDAKVTRIEFSYINKEAM